MPPPGTPHRAQGHPPEGVDQVDLVRAKGISPKTDLTAVREKALFYGLLHPREVNLVNFHTAISVHIPSFEKFAIRQGLFASTRCEAFCVF